MHTNDSGGHTLACPDCRASLAADMTGYRCASCRTLYRLEDGILVFTPNSTALGEFSREEMEELLRAAAGSGWKAALATYVEQKNPAVLELILDSRRTSFLTLLPQPQGGIALDFGCGFGGISVQLARKYRQVFALDSGLERLRFLNVIRKQERIGNIQAIHHENAASLPFADRSIDLAVLVGVFEYLPLAFPDQPVRNVQRRVLGELSRILKPGGHLYIGTKNRFGWPYLKGAADHNRLRFGPVLPRLLADWLTQRLYGKPYRIIVDSLPGYRGLLRGAGFREPRFYWPLPGYQVPDAFVPLWGGSDEANAPFDATMLPGWKGRAALALRAAGVLKYVVPHFSIVAQKP